MTTDSTLLKPEIEIYMTLRATIQESVQPLLKLARLVIVGVADGKVTHEHIYWDQATVLVQLGLLDPAGLPVSGAEQARLVLDPTGPYRTEY